MATKEKAKKATQTPVSTKVFRLPKRNRAEFIGFLTKDPEMRFTPSGKEHLTFTVAVNNRFQGSDGEWRETTAYIRCVAWTERAKWMGERLKKGTAVEIIGRLNSRDYEKDGQRHWVTEVVTLSCQVLEKSESN